jgi:hypothetical protein
MRGAETADEADDQNSARVRRHLLSCRRWRQEGEEEADQCKSAAGSCAPRSCSSEVEAWTHLPIIIYDELRKPRGCLRHLFRICTVTLYPVSWARLARFLQRKKC